MPPVGTVLRIGLGIVLLAGIGTVVAGKSLPTTGIPSVFAQSAGTAAPTVTGSTSSATAEAPAPPASPLPRLTPTGYGADEIVERMRNPEATWDDGVGASLAAVRPEELAAISGVTYTVESYGALEDFRPLTNSGFQVHYVTPDEADPRFISVFTYFTRDLEVGQTMFWAYAKRFQTIGRWKPGARGWGEVVRPSYGEDAVRVTIWTDDVETGKALIVRNRASLVVIAAHASVPDRELDAIAALQLRRMPENY